MELYFLTYDLRNIRDYQKLYDELESYKALPVLESTWCFKRSGTNVIDLRDHFMRFVDPDDGLLISKSESWATAKTKNSPKDLK